MTESPQLFDYAALAADLATPDYAGMTDAEAAAHLMQTEAVWVDVPLGELEGHCRQSLILARLQERVAEAEAGLPRLIAREFLGLVTGKLSQVEMSHAGKRAGVLAMLGALAAAEWLTQDDVAGIVALAQQQQPRCAALGWPAVTEHDVAHARGAR